MKMAMTRLAGVWAAAVMVALPAVVNAQVQVQATNAVIRGNTTSLSTNLTVLRISTIPYRLRFMAESDFPVGSNRDGFVAVKYTQKMKSKTSSGGATGTVDVSELTLQRGNRTVVLVKGVPVDWTEQTVDLLDLTDIKTYSLRTGEETTIGGHKVRLQTVDPTGMKCTLVDSVTGEQITVTKRSSVSTSNVDLTTGLTDFRQLQKVVYREWLCVETNRYEVDGQVWTDVTTTRQTFGTNGSLRIEQGRSYVGDYWIAENELTIRSRDRSGYRDVAKPINATFAFAVSDDVMVLTNKDTGDVHHFHRVKTTNE